MIRLADPDDDVATDTAAAFQPQPANGLCARLGDRWTVQVLWRLSLAEGRRLRFSALKGEVEGVTQRMLTLSLRNLERDGLLIRHYFPEVPPRVEYQLTEMGMGMLAALESVNTWVRESLPHIEENRRVYDLARR